jgi:hypothetical protein
MALRVLFGLEDMDISDADIMAKIKDAFDHDLQEVQFVKGDGTKVIIKLPRIDFAHHIDPWDGVVFGRGAA